MAHLKHNGALSRLHQSLGYQGELDLVRIIFNAANPLDPAHAYTLIESSVSLLELQIWKSGTTVPLDVPKLRDALKETKKLEILEIIGCEFSSTSVKFVPAKLKRLSLRGCTQLKDMIDDLPSLTALIAIDVSEAGLRQVKGTAEKQVEDILDKISNAKKRLTELVISDNNDTNHGCIDMIPAELEEYEVLRLIDARNTAITPQMAADFVAAWKVNFPSATHEPRVLAAGSRPCA